MNREKIKKAAQLADDLKKVEKAIGLISDHEKIAVRISANVGGGNSEETLFAYLPKRIVPAIYSVLIDAQKYINQEMEDL